MENSKSYRYILNLYKQYCDAKDLVFRPIMDITSTEGFTDWLIENIKISRMYRDYIMNLGFADGKTIAEIGKGKYDSIADNDFSVISPYGEEMDQICSDFFIIGKYPLVSKEGIVCAPSENILLTHNPFDESMSQYWYRMHNALLYDISVGVYGNINDHDRNEKINLIMELSKRMTRDYGLESDTNGNNYFCTVYSKKIVKKREGKKVDIYGEE